MVITLAPSSTHTVIPDIETMYGSLCSIRFLILIYSPSVSRQTRFVLEGLITRVTSEVYKCDN